MDIEKIRRQNMRRMTPQDKLRDALASRPDAYRYTPRGLVMGGAPPLPVQSSSLARQSTPSRPRSAPVPIHSEEATSVLITGGVGDFLAVDSFLSEPVRQRIRHVALATRAQAGIRELIAANPSYQNCTTTVLFDDWSRFFCFFTKEEVTRHVGARMPRRCVDLSISQVFGQINRGGLKFQGSAFTASTNAEIHHLRPPDRYVTVCPYSLNDRRYRNRDFDAANWEDVLGFLDETAQVGVVINLGMGRVPKHARLVDLSNRTTLPEAVEVVKQSRGYIGIDSCLSVIASKVLQFPDLFIKSSNRHLEENRAIYYAPQSQFDFIGAGFGGLKQVV